MHECIVLLLKDMQLVAVNQASLIVCHCGQTDT